MAEFKRRYLDVFKRKFAGEIPCVTHVINLIVEDIMSEIKAKPPKNDEIAETFGEPPGMYFLFIYFINII
jgi:hypothetical protein